MKEVSHSEQMGIGTMQIVLIVFVVLLLFGAGRLPRVMGDIGKGVRSLKEGLREEDTADAKRIEDNKNS